MKKTTKKVKALKTSHELANALGISSPVDQAMMTYKAELSSLAVKAIANSGLTVNDIVERSGVARSKVSAIKNGAIAGISLELFLKVIMGCGKRITIKAA
ncbi:XRE family transcriptional regulator [Bdellovibrio sp. HCB-162]|uniref:XRE family transcriptional regulator n=1 Tax=Bdellovibrio sp. HCB-162 TaxID=3394234 RepID=UPI0039BCBF53